MEYFLPKARSISYLSIFLWVVAVMPLPFAYGQPHIRVIVNPSVAVQQLTTSQARWIFSMRQTSWPDGQAIKVFVLESQNPAHSVFAKTILGVFPYQLERTWNQLAFSGLGDKPFTVTDEAQMLEMVSQQSGAIGYVVTNAASLGTQVIQIIKE